MKFSLGFAASLLFATRVLLAQVGGVNVDISLNQEQFLPAEDIEAAVKITNLSGQTLEMGQDNRWLRFIVTKKSGAPVRQISEVPVEGEFSLQSSLAGTKRVNLMPAFDLREPGNYQVQAVLSIPNWNLALTTQPKTFEVVKGTVLKELPFGVPLAPGESSRPPEVRRYVLTQANYLKDNLSLYVRVTDESGNHTYKVVRAGRLTSFTKPEAQIDSASNFHLLFQTGARRFLYSVIDPNGKILVRQTHEISDLVPTRPKLKDAGEGKILVAGGVRRLMATDLPTEPEREAVGEAN